MLQRTEIGLVSTDETVVEFYATVFDLTRLPATQAGTGAVHRLQGPGTAIKVMVPKRPPTPTAPVDPFFAATGLRYLTLYVTDLDEIIDRATAHGGHVQLGPMDLGPGVRLVILRDPDGNTLEVVSGTP